MKKVCIIIAIICLVASALVAFVGFPILREYRLESAIALFDAGELLQNLSDELDADFQKGESLKLEAVTYLRKLAKKGNATAQFYVGKFCFDSGDFKDAFYWYRKSAEQGFANSQNNLGVMYENAYHVTKDEFEAFRLYQLAAEQNLGIAQRNVGRCYYYGIGVFESNDEAKKWLKKAIENDDEDSEAHFLLGLCYEDEKSLHLAFRHYLKSAEWGNDRGQLVVAMCYLGGQGVEKDFNEAFKWMLKAANQGIAFAQNKLAIMYAEGVGVTADVKEAIKWHERAAEQGFVDSIVRCGVIALAIEEYTTAVRYFQEAANQGDASAQFNLGGCYAKGYGVSQSRTEAVKWFRKSAEQGNASAQANLGVCYANGDGVSQSWTEAVKWYRKSAEQGDANAQLILGGCYTKGYGVSQSWTEAVKWYRKSAEQGDADAQLILGVCYENGKGVSQSYSEAVKWYRKAAEQGDPDAKEALKRLGY